jgi:uncharacterized protein (DUF2141 family)
MSDEIIITPPAPIDITVTPTVTPTVGATGPANILAIGTVVSGVTASATITGSSPNQTLNLTLPQGSTGATGATGATGEISASIYNSSRHFATNSIETFTRDNGNSNALNAVNGAVYFSCFTSTANFTVSQISAYCYTGKTDIGGTTVRRLGLYSVSGTTFTLIARIASDATLFTTSGQLYTRSFSTTGGYPSSVTITAGTRYAVGKICYNTGGTYMSPALIYGVAFDDGSLWNVSPAVAVQLTSQTDLPTTTSSTVKCDRNIWARLT